VEKGNSRKREKHDSLSKIEKIAQSRLKMIAPKKREFININE
jgi:2-oxo-4-hydroxy-4-carboxy--5-ureidoimidazoline (OHCU) decarboxylase